VDAVFERALGKEPAARYPTAAQFVGDLRRAFDAAAGATVVTLPAAARRRSTWWIPLLVGLLLAAGVVAGLLATRRSGSPSARTVIRTVTTPGRTVQETVTTSPATSAPTTAAATTAPTSSASGRQLNNEGYAKMGAGDYAGALPLLEQAVQKLDGTGVIDEAYAKYNLAYTRFALGDCTDVLTLLDEAERIEGHRVEIDRLRKRAKHC
jgi:tetratricopeptide (TPR) repeat protein